MLNTSLLYNRTYRNVLREYGFSDEAINERVQDTWNKLFSEQHPDTQIYYQVGKDEGYILDTGNLDV